MLARIAFRFSYDSFMVVLEDMGTKGRVLPLSSRLALMMSLDASMKSHRLVLSYGISSCSKCSVISLQKHKSSFTMNYASRSSFRFLYSIIFTPFSRRLRSRRLDAWNSLFSVVKYRSLHKLFRASWENGIDLFSLSESLGSEYSALECSSELFQLCISWSGGLGTGKFSECSTGRIADCKFG